MSAWQLNILILWEQLIGNRKSPLRQASIIGLGTLIRVFTRNIGLEELVDTVSERIGIKGRAIVWSHAEACMDVDKPHQLELLRKDLAKQERKTTMITATRKKIQKEVQQKPLQNVQAAPKRRPPLLP